MVRRNDGKFKAGKWFDSVGHAPRYPRNKINYLIKAGNLFIPAELFDSSKSQRRSAIR